MRNGRYYVNLPWKSQNPEDLDDNRVVVETRLNQLYKESLQNKEILHDYDKTILVFSENHHAEEVIDAQLLTHKRVYYMPHHAMIREPPETTRL